MKRQFFLLLLLVSCTLDAAPPTPTAIPAHNATPEAITPPSPWETLAPGLERRTFTPGGNFLARVVALRIDPALYAFRAHYAPGMALSAGKWRDALPDAVAFVNANFFDTANTIQGLLVADSQVYGESYRSRGGTFAVQGGQPRLFANSSSTPTGESLEQAVQAFPMLVIDGQSVRRDEWSERPTRRTAIGIDAQGRVILLTTPLLGLSLGDLSDFLAESEINLVTALNLDGGGSTMMHIAPADYLLSSFDPVPAVLAVYPKP